MSEPTITIKTKHGETGYQDTYPADSVTWFMSGLVIPWNDEQERFIPWHHIDSVNIPMNYHVDIK